jgi:hypothetical protein
VTWQADLAAYASEIACPEPGCGADEGEPCRNLGTGKPLQSRPAHERRLWDSGAVHRGSPRPDLEGDPT